MTTTPKEARVLLRARLEDRRPELSEAIGARIYAISDSDVADPVYLEGLRESVSVALDYALESIERGEEHAPPIPPALRAQARMAARSGIGLDTVLRRYFAGYTLLADFIAAEVDAGRLPGQLLQVPAATLFDRLLAAVSEEWAREKASCPDSSEQRHTERIERLLAGEVIDTAAIGYEFGGDHIGLVASGRGAEAAARRLAGSLGYRLLLVRRGEGHVWAWLGCHQSVDSADVERLISSTVEGQVTFALGEPAKGLAGWRLTYRQAAATLPIALRRNGRVTRYADVATLATMLQDDVLIASLRQLYLARLDDDRDHGVASRETLRAYFAADCNVSSAAAALGLSRHTVARRLQTIEERLDRPLTSCKFELDAALRLEKLGVESLR